jgi:hypothetical protein
MRLVEAAKREVGPDGLIGDVSGGTATVRTPRLEKTTGS